MKSSLQNKVIWLTGASSGIGEALAYSLAQKGAKLILSSRKLSDLQRIKENSKKDKKADIELLPFDLCDSDTLPEHAEKAISHFGKVDILINNGGVSQRAHAKDTQLEVYRRLMEINYFAPIYLTKLLLPTMIENGFGHIVNMSSLVGKFGTPYRSGYAATKHALHGFFDSLRAELFTSNIKVTMVCPGFIRTDISINALSEDGSPYGKMDNAQAKGMMPNQCAKRIVKAIEKQKEEVLIGGKETFTVYLKRFFPLLFSRVVRKASVR